jgi:hypothetical protein
MTRVVVVMSYPLPVGGSELSDYMDSGLSWPTRPNPRLRSGHPPQSYGDHIDYRLTIRTDQPPKPWRPLFL